LHAHLSLMKSHISKIWEWVNYSYQVKSHLKLYLHRYLYALVSTKILTARLQDKASGHQRYFCKSHIHTFKIGLVKHKMGVAECTFWRTLAGIDVFDILAQELTNIWMSSRDVEIYLAFR